MNADRYLKVDELFDAALELKSDERAPYLDRACGSDAELRHEVELLLDAFHKAGDFIETPALQVAAQSLAEDSNLSLTGKTISRYEIISLLGAGGMGEVYLARDPQMNRQVALKLLPAEFTQSPDRVARFQRESRAASALNHPNIITIYEIGQARGLHFIASEFIDGDTIRRKLSRGKLTVKEAIEIAIQAASALSAAHAAGIVHRDIKPENIMLRPDGYVKVLDFGLAKLIESKDSDPNQSAPDHTTQSGAVLGTINYMSPEQALGRDIDNRTDVFSLGVVLFEMVTGFQPFKGTTAAATFDAILNKPPAPLTSSNTDASVELERIINRALEKDRDVRYQTAADLRAVLKRLQKTIDSQVTASAGKMAHANAAHTANTVSRGWKKAALIFAALALVAPFAVLFAQRLTKASPPAWANATATKLSADAGPEYFPSLAPDGKSLIYASRIAGNWDVYLKRLGSKKIVNLTEDAKQDDTQPVFSPDGARIAFRSDRNGGGIFVMSETGESVRQVCGFGYNPAWSPDSKELVVAEVPVEDFSRSRVPSRLWIVNVETGASRVLTESDAVNPAWSPHGTRIAYWGVEKAFQRDIWTIPAAGGQAVRLTDDEFIDWNPVWSPDGRYIYFVSNRKGTMNIWRIAVDEASGKASGEPELVPTPAAFSQHISFSRDGKRMAYGELASPVNISKLEFDPAAEKVIGQPVAITQGSGALLVPNISPDGQWLVYQEGTIQRDILTLKVGSQVPNQLTDDVFNDTYPVWSPDGRKIAFCSSRGGNMDIWTINPDGSGRQQITDLKEQKVFKCTWSPDGARMAYYISGGRSFIIDLTKPFSEQTPQEIVFDNGAKQFFVAMDWSPDGKYLTGHLTNGETLIEGVYIYSFASGRFDKISDFGSRACWLGDSRRLLFSYQERLYVVDRETRTPKAIHSFNQSRAGFPSVSKDNRSIYLSLSAIEADIWVLSLD